MAFKDWSLVAADNDDADGDIALIGNSTSIRNADNSQRAIMQKVAIWRDDTNGSRSTTGSSNAYLYASAGAGATPADGFAVYATGDTLTVQANHTNTGAATLDVDSVGAKAIRKYSAGSEAALVSGDIVSAAPFTVIYDEDANSAAGAWILQNPTFPGLYESGTFTPTLTFGGGNTGMTGTFSGWYTKIGNVVTFNIRITLTAKGSSTGNASINNLPFTSADGTNQYQPVSMWINAMSAGLQYAPIGLILSNTTAVLPYVYGGGTEAQFTHSSYTDTSVMYINGTYLAD